MKKKTIVTYKNNNNNNKSGRLLLIQLLKIYKLCFKRFVKYFKPEECYVDIVCAVYVIEVYIYLYII